MKTITRSHLRKDLFYTFDIETTTLITGLDEKNHPIRNAIIWSGQFYDGCDYIQTRNLADTIKRLKLIEEENIDNPYKVVVFVHNLSYEFQFIKDFFDFEQILCTTTRTRSGRRFLGTNGATLWLWSCLPKPGAPGP